MYPIGRKERYIYIPFAPLLGGSEEFLGKGGSRELESVRLAAKWFDFGRVCGFVEDRKVDNWSRRKVKREVW